MSKTKSQQGSTKVNGPLEAYALGVIKLAVWLTPAVVSALVTTLVLRTVLSPSTTIVLNNRRP